MELLAVLLGTRADGEWITFSLWVLGGLAVIYLFAFMILKQIREKKAREAEAAESTTGSTPGLLSPQ